jgi:hypothetical protein
MDQGIRSVRHTDPGSDLHQGVNSVRRGWSTMRSGSVPFAAIADDGAAVRYLGNQHLISGHASCDGREVLVARTPIYRR